MEFQNYTWKENFILVEAKIFNLIININFNKNGQKH